MTEINKLEENKLEENNFSGGNNNKRSRFSAPIGAKAKSNTTVKALPRHSGVKKNRRSRRHAWRAKGGGNVYCINDPYILGRLVQHDHNFYYVSKIEKDEIDEKIIKHIEIKQGENDPIKIKIEDIKKIEPYNYYKVINSLLSLFKIILEKKYLYHNDTKHNIAKMEIIEIINTKLENIKYNNTKLDEDVQEEEEEEEESTKLLTKLVDRWHPDEDVNEENEEEMRRR